MLLSELKRWDLAQGEEMLETIEGDFCNRCGGRIEEE